MAESEVGDDVFQEDLTVRCLEDRMATLFGKEAGLFFPTGTMANLTAVMTWCDGRGAEMILGASSHIFIYEQGGSAFLGGVASRAIPNEEDGSLKIESILNAIRADNIHYPITQLVCLENTQNFCGGRVLPAEYINDVAAAIRPYRIPLHIDGARIWNASMATGQSVRELTAGANSVSVCMSKGLGAPCGSVLLGPADWIKRARRIRKALGGGMRQVGVLAAACLQGLDDFEAGKLFVDHTRAKHIADSVSKMPGFIVHSETVESNIIVVHIDSAVTNSSAVAVSKLLKEHGVLCNNRNDTSLRIVTHRDLDDANIDKVIQAFGAVSSIISSRP
jgi:threonine aldolase